MPDATELNVVQTSDATLLATTIFGDGVTIVSSSLTGNAVQSGIYSGADATVGDVAPSDTGVIFSTGNTGDITNSTGTTDTNTAGNTGTNLSGNTDADLTALNGGSTTFDAVIFEATFIPTGDFLTMQFTFSSEEYLEYVNSGFSDVLGVWVNDEFVPLTPTGDTVSINTVNQGVNSNFYVDNAATDDTFNTEMDGLTVTLSMKAPVNFGEENTIKIGLADSGDGGYDSNVLIAADSAQVVALAMSDEVTLAPNSSRVLDILGNDVDQAGGGLTVLEINGQSVVAGDTITLGTGEQITLNADGTVTITSDGDITSSSLTYTVIDADGVTDVGYITINTVASPAPDGIVEGTASGDVIDGSYVGDPNGDNVDDNDSLGVEGTTGDGDVIYGFGGDDSITSGAGDDIIYAGADNDTVDAGAGNDTVYGGMGADNITGGDGDNTLFGGDGSDFIIVSDGATTTDIKGGEDIGGGDLDTLLLDNSTSGQGVDVVMTGDEAGTFSFDGTPGTGTFDEIEIISGSTSDDTFDLSGATGTTTINAGGGADTITSGAADDTIYLGDGVFFADGDDQIVLSDGFGDDIIFQFDAPTDNGDGTFTGIDTLDVTTLTDGTDPVNVNDVTVSDDGSGNAVLTFPNGESITLDGIDPADADNPFYLNAIGIPLSDGTVSGTAGDDTIDAGYVDDSDGDLVDDGDAILAGDVDDDDLIEGNGGDDSITAGAGEDEVYGGTGSDTIDGGVGNDVLYGGDTGEVANLIVNGSFEDLTGTIDTSWGDKGVGSITGWTDYNGGDLDLHDNGKGGTYATDGTHVLDMGGSPDNVHVYQDIPGAVDGETYALTLDAGDVNGGGNSVEIYWGGELIATIDPVEGDMESFAFDLIGGAGDGANRLEFKEIGPIDVDGVQLDNIQLIGVDGTAATQDTSGDSIDGGVGDDTVYGLQGDDTLDGGTGNDSVDGGAGSDTINVAAGEGTDTIKGGEDVDGSDVDTLSFVDGSGPDGVDITMTGDEEGIYTYPTDGGDGTFTQIEQITLSDQNDTFDGVLATGGNTVDGGAGNDALTGSSGDDSFVGGSGDDTLTGGDGADTMTGGADDDTIYGGAGDVIDGSETGTDNDTLLVQDVNYIEYDPGNPENGTVYFNGGGTLVFTNIENVIVTDRDGTVSGTADDDVIDAGYTGDPDGDLVDSGDAILIGDTGDDDLIEAGTGNDSIDAGAGNDEIYGGADNDTIGGGADDDTIYGGTGDDIIDGGTGVDVQDGGDGDDTFILRDSFGDDTITGGENGETDGDTLDASGLSTGVTVDLETPGASDPEMGTISDGTSTATFDDIENLILTDQDDTVTGSSGGETIQLGAGDDTVDMNGGDDTLLGGADDDTFIAGDDFNGATVTGGQAGSNYDTLDLSGLTNPVTVVFTGPGAGTVTDDVTGDVMTFSEIEFLITTNQADTVDATLDDGYTYVNTLDGADTYTGSDGDDVVDDEMGTDGGAGNDTFYGGGGNDQILAGDDDDIIFGGTGDDTLNGQDGDDTINGGTGSDTITGDVGDDTITFSEGDSASGGDGDDLFVLEDLGEPTNGTITIDGGSGDETADPDGAGPLTGGDTLQLGGLATLTQDVRDTFMDDGTGSYSGSVTLDDGTILNFSEIENIICFTPGTRIATPQGLVNIEDLEVGDLVVTRDHGLQPIRWIEGRVVPAVDRFAPVRISKNVLSGQERDLLVSPQHRVLFQGYRAELLFGESEVLVAAKHLIDGLDVTQDEQDTVTYVHMLFDQHEIIFAEGAATESFHPGDIGFTAVAEAAREELFAIFPELRVDPRHYGTTARRCLKEHEAKLIRH